jgi:hypothetical protein
VDSEISRFVRAVSHGEWWQAHPGNWHRLHTSHCRALVRPADPVRDHCTGWLWAVKLTSSGQLFAGAGDSQHEATRAAERVIEEHRPE